MKKNVTLILVLIAAVVAIAAALFFNKGNAPIPFVQSEEDKVAAAVDGAISNITSTSDENVRERLGDELCNALEDAEIAPADFYRAVFGHVEHETSGVFVSEDHASCTVGLDNIDFNEAMSNYNKAVNEWAISDDAIATLSKDGQEGMTRKLLGMLMEQLTADGLPTHHSEVSVNLEQGESGGWQLAEGTEDALVNSMLGNLSLDNIV